MDDAAVVGRFESRRDLAGDRQGLVDGQRTIEKTIGEGRPFNKFQNERLDTVRFFESVNSRNVRMIERRKHLGFALQACDALGISREAFEHDLDGDRALQFRIARAVHLAHAASTERVNDLVRADSRPCGKRHGVASILLAKLARSSGLESNDADTLLDRAAHRTSEGRKLIVKALVLGKCCAEWRHG
jgi:hypothetical protein